MQLTRNTSRSSGGRYEGRTGSVACELCQLAESNGRENWRRRLRGRWGPEGGSSEVTWAVHAVVRGWHADTCDYPARAERQKSSSHIFVKNRTSIIQHTSISKLYASGRYVRKRWACQPLAYKDGKYDIKWCISSTMNTVLMFFTRNMTAHFVHWRDLTHIRILEGKLWICNRKLQDYLTNLSGGLHFTRVWSR